MALKWFPIVGAAVALSSCSDNSALLRYNIGEAYSAEAVSKMNMDLTMDMGTQGSRAMTTDMGFYMTVDGLAPTEAGNQLMAMSIDRITMNLVADSMDVKYDSDMEGAELTDSEQFIDALIGAEIEMEYTDRGELVGIPNMEELVDHMIGRMGMSDSAQAPFMKQMMMAQMTPDQFQSQFGMNNMTYPEAAVKVGDTWNTTMERNTSFPMTIDVVYEVLSISDASVEVKMDGSANSAQSPVPGMTIEGNMNGTLTIDRATGMVTTSVGTMDFVSDAQMGEMALHMVIKGDFDMSFTQK